MKNKPALNSVGLSTSPFMSDPMETSVAGRKRQCFKGEINLYLGADLGFSLEAEVLPHHQSSPVPRFYSLPIPSHCFESICNVAAVAYACGYTPFWKLFVTSNEKKISSVFLLQGPLFSVDYI